MKILTSLLLFMSPYLFSAELVIEPVYGIERTQREYPKPAKYRTTTFVGVRGLYGVPSFSAELELNQSLNKEDFPVDNLSVTYNSQKALFGFRTYPIHSEYVGMFFRFGVRAEQKQRTIVESDIERSEKDPIIIDPYAGTGLTLVLGKMFALNAGATLVYNKNASDESEKFDTRYTFSFSIKAGSK